MICGALSLAVCPVGSGMRLVSPSPLCLLWLVTISGEDDVFLCCEVHDMVQLKCIYCHRNDSMFRFFVLPHLKNDAIL